jgi:hypothetical protein
VTTKGKVATALAIAACLLLAPTAASGAPSGQAAKRCSPPSDNLGSGGPTYYHGLRVTGVSCRDGRGYIGKWSRCRRRRGGRDGRCRRPGNGFGCRERRSNVISTQYDGVVGCRRGGDLVKFRYTQFT